MTHVIYHANCADGFTAAWIANKYLEIGANNKLLFYPCQYGDEFPTIPKGQFTYILDFSFPREIMMREMGERPTIVLDHHKTAEADLKDIPGVIFDMNESGASLACKYFAPDDPVPLLVSYVKDRDLWRFDLPVSRSISAWIKSYPFTFANWELMNGVIETNFEIAVIQGDACLRLMDRQVEDHVSRAVFTKISGYHIPYVNATVHFSEVATALLQTYSRAKFAACYFDRGDGWRQWSLRSRADFDVSEIAKLYGGGGHAQAAGFTSKLTWLGD